MPILPTTPGSFDVERTVRLPQSADWFLAARRFPFSIDKSTCGARVQVKDRQVSLAIAPELQPYLDDFTENHFSASVAEVSEAAMQFYQTQETLDWPAERYADKLHMLRYDIGLAFDETADHSIAQVRQDVFHGEARRPVIELLGYGLTVLAAARLLKVSTDRFIFLRGADSRPDFAATIRLEDVLGPNAATTLITKEGFKIGLESKARGQHQGFFVTRGKNTGRPNEVLTSMLEKYASKPDGDGFLGFLVTTQLRNDDRTGMTRLALVDPGEAKVLPEQRQVVLLLRALMTRLRRVGVWGSLHRAAEWLLHLGDQLSTAEASFLVSVPRTDSFLPRERYRGHPYIGRIFSDVLRRLGPTRQPRISRAEIEERLASSDPGALWYHGVSTEVADLIAGRDTDALMSFGVGVDPPLATVRLPYYDFPSAAGVLSLLDQALPYAQ